MADLRHSFLIGSELGAGYSGVVRKCCQLSTGTHFACKSSSKGQDVRMEICAMKRLRGCPNVVELKGVYEDKKNVHLILDLCTGGDMFDYLSQRGKIPEREAAYLLRQLAVGLKCCAAMGVIHRDVKPENIFISSFTSDADGTKMPRVKLGDFGLAAAMAGGETRTRGMAGSCLYMAPELIMGHDYDSKVDIWSTGVTMYAALAGLLPFWGQDNREIFSSICASDPDYEQQPWPSISYEAKHLIRWMLNPDPLARASAVQILNHPWILLNCSPPTSPRTPTSSPRRLSHSSLPQTVGKRDTLYLKQSSILSPPPPSPCPPSSPSPNVNLSTPYASPPFSVQGGVNSQSQQQEKRDVTSNVHADTTTSFEPNLPSVRTLRTIRTAVPKKFLSRQPRPPNSSSPLSTAAMAALEGAQKALHPSPPSSSSSLPKPHPPSSPRSPTSSPHRHTIHTPAPCNSPTFKNSQYSSSKCHSSALVAPCNSPVRKKSVRKQPHLSSKCQNFQSDQNSQISEQNRQSYENCGVFDVSHFPPPPS